jgi:hypothetical protein
MSNKFSATEDEIGKLHELITKAHSMKAGLLITTAQELMDMGATPDEILSLINSRDLATMQKWVEYNGVGCKVAEDDETSELSKRLKELKKAQSGKIVSFTDVKDAI